MAMLPVFICTFAFTAYWSRVRASTAEIDCMVAVARVAAGSYSRALRPSAACQVCMHLSGVGGRALYEYRYADYVTTCPLLTFTLMATLNLPYKVAARIFENHLPPLAALRNSNCLRVCMECKDALNAGEMARVEWSGSLNH